ncbi:uncharacterized protein VP01_6304g1, partial [Puccinia sorghi]
DFNQHTCTVGWDNNPLMSLYQKGLKENTQIAVVMDNIEFEYLWSMQVMAMKAGQTIEVIQLGHPNPNLIPSTSTSTPTHNPNAMDLSTFQKAPSKWATYPADV